MSKPFHFIFFPSGFWGFFFFCLTKRWKARWQSIVESFGLQSQACSCEEASELNCPGK